MTDFFILGAGRPFTGKQHTALRPIDNSAHVLDWSLLAVAHLTPNCYFVSGYEAESVQESYPQLNYIHNNDWESTRAGWSFLGVLPTKPKETLVSYSDILFREATVKKLMQTDGDVVVAVDSQWRSRYAGRNLEDLNRCEKVCVLDDGITCLGANIDISKATAEFIGLARFSKKAIEQLAEIKKLSDSDNAHLKQANLSNLIELLRIRGLKVVAVEVDGDWSELNESADIARFILGTKAQTLSRFKQIVKLSRIEDQVSFTVDHWVKDPLFWINKIQETLGKVRLIIRSSAISEDGFLSSSAGAYASVLDVPGENVEAIQEVVENVINSYPDKNLNNEVLVQPMLNNVLVSGVIFTRSLSTGAPYYTINYDDISGTTESITGGTSLEDKTLIILRNTNENDKSIPKKLKSLLPALREIETLIGYDSLDIEFAITAEQGLHILQVRPIAIDHNMKVVCDQDFYTTIKEAKTIFKKQLKAPPFVLGKQTLYGVMPDWNPAEIIGIKPGLLATSLYSNLILDKIWATQRTEYGYRDVRPQPLLVSFVGHPYIDIRLCFNSFIPQSLPDELAEKIINFCLKWLSDHPELHDKVEFDVIPTCFDLDFSRWSKRFADEGGFSSTEIQQISEAYLSLTNNAFKRNAKDLAVIKQLEKRYQSIKNSSLPSLKKAFVLLEDSRRYGTLPFAHLARSAFVAISLLRSAVSNGDLTEAERDDFLNTIHTVSKELLIDSAACAKGNLHWDDLIEKYGHLRPGTYDINSKSYRQDAERFLRPIVDNIEHKQESDNTDVGLLWTSVRNKFAQSVIESGLHLTVDELESFMRTAIEGREYAKFIFTRNLSLALDEISLWGKEIGIDKEIISNLSIEDLALLLNGSVSITNIKQWVLDRAKENQQGAVITKLLELPPLITNANNFSVFLHPASQANYIGSGKVTATCVGLEKNHSSDLVLDGKIILIPQADPGYDWLFGNNIAGLITMYGGANSHMAIRAAEFNLPAAIGIGETHYQVLSDATKLELNAGQRLIRVIY